VLSGSSRFEAFIAFFSLASSGTMNRGLHQSLFQKYRYIFLKIIKNSMFTVLVNYEVMLDEGNVPVIFFII
jgi:hypothetical protein